MQRLCELVHIAIIGLTAIHGVVICLLVAIVVGTAYFPNVREVSDYLQSRGVKELCSINHEPLLTPAIKSPVALNVADLVASPIEDRPMHVANPLGLLTRRLASRPYFNRYTEDAVDLCDLLSSFSYQGKAKLHELCRVMGLPGKPAEMSGEEVEKYYRDGPIRDIAEYCESEVVNAYRLWLRYELFRGRLTDAGFQASEACLTEFISTRVNVKSDRASSEQEHDQQARAKQQPAAAPIAHRLAKT